MQPFNPFRPDDDDDKVPPERFDESPDDQERPLTGNISRASTSDPLFGLLIAGAISVGLVPLIGSDAADMRYTLSWGILALFGVLAWLVGRSARVQQEIPENLVWGVVFGFILSIPVLAMGGGTLAEISRLMFEDMGHGTLLAYLIFVMPLAETLFFRAVLQEHQPFWAVALLCTIWHLVLFFPLVNRGPYPLVVGVVMVMANMMHSYVRQRNGLAAAWLCQITVNLMIIFVPFAML